MALYSLGSSGRTKTRSFVLIRGEVKKKDNQSAYSTDGIKALEYFVRRSANGDGVESSTE